MDKNSYLVELSESDATDFGRVAFAEQSELQKVFSAVYGLEDRSPTADLLSTSPVRTVTPPTMRLQL